MAPAKRTRRKKKVAAPVSPPAAAESTAIMLVKKSGSPDQAPVPRRYRVGRKLVAIRLREKVISALDTYVFNLQEKDDTVTRTEIVETAIRQYLKRQGAYED